MYLLYIIYYYYIGNLPIVKILIDNLKKKFEFIKNFLKYQLINHNIKKLFHLKTNIKMTVFDEILYV